jgi:hypothetical protein
MANIHEALAKAEFVASALAHHRTGDMFHPEGMYFCLSGAIEEIRTALEEIEEIHIPMNKVA